MGSFGAFFLFSEVVSTQGAFGPALKNAALDRWRHRAVAIARGGGEMRPGALAKESVAMPRPIRCDRRWRAARVCPVDFNGDGRNDVAVTSFPWSDLRVYLDVGGGDWEWLSVAGGAYTGLTDVKCGDIDGDGRPDLVTIATEHLGGDHVAWWPNP